MKIGLLAGEGRLPSLLAEHVKFQHVLNLLQWPKSLGALDAIVDAVQQSGCDTLVLAGAVDRGRFCDLDAGGQWVAARTKPGAGDGHLLDVFIAFFEDRGFTVVGAGDLLPALRTPTGVLTGGGAALDVRAGLARARALGLKDLGQAVVQCGDGLWLEETTTGTNDLLARAGEAPESPRILFKAAKPQQDLRVDMPTWGLETVDHAARHGVQTLVFEAENTLALDLQQAVQQAEALGLTIIGARA